MNIARNIKNRIRRRKLPKRVFMTGNNGKLERLRGKLTFRLIDTVQMFLDGQGNR